MEELETSSTSARTAECSPVVLRSSDQVRLIFRPVIVDNRAQPRACINGEFVYERKKKNGVWEATNTVSLNSVKTGEQYKLGLHASELLALMETIGPLYRTCWQDRSVPVRRTKFVRLEEGLAHLVKMSQGDLDRFLDAHPSDAVAVLARVLTWLAKRPVTTEAAAALAAVDPVQLPSLSALLGVSTLRAAQQEWQANAMNSDEDYWQNTLSRFSFVLSHLFAYPVVVIREKAYLGGKALDNQGGSVLDFLMASASTSAVALVEIKTPTTDLLGKEYRTGALPPSRELTGALAQVLKYRSTFTRQFDSTSRASPTRLVMGGCPALVVAGDCSQLDSDEKRESFERFRSQLRDVAIVTFDELLKRLSDTLALLEGAVTAL